MRRYAPPRTQTGLECFKIMKMCESHQYACMHIYFSLYTHTENSLRFCVCDKSQLARINYQPADEPKSSVTNASAKLMNTQHFRRQILIKRIFHA